MAKNKAKGFVGVAVAASLLTGLGGFARAADETVISATIAPGGLGQKLVDGSPWEVRTPYEATVHHFRIGADGRVQRMSPTHSGEGWQDFTISDAQTATYATNRGHTIRFYLDSSGKPNANHSKHNLSFRSVK